MNKFKVSLLSMFFIVLTVSVIAVATTLLLTKKSPIAYIAGDFVQDMFDPSFLTPNELAKEREKNLAVRNTAVDMASLSTLVEENPLLADIQGEEIHGYLQDLTEFSQKSKADGEVLWGRIQGSKYEYEASKYVEQHFKNVGIDDIRFERFKVQNPLWRPAAIELSVNNNQDEKIKFNSAMTAFPSGVTEVSGLTAPIEYVGLGTRADLRGKNLEGKIALLYVRAWEGVLLHSGHLASLRLVKQHGAAGVILWLDLPGNNQYAAQLFSSEGFLTEVPWTNIGYEDGLYLRKLIEHSPVDQPPQVTLTVNGTMESDLMSQNVIAELPGNSDKTIMITAHIDGFFNASLDNGTGVAALMTLARHYSDIPQNQRPYNLLFVVTGDHEQAGHGGIVDYVKNNKDEFDDVKLIVQLEHMASPGVNKELNQASLTNTEASRILMVTNRSPWLVDLFTSAATRYGIVMGKSVMQEYAGDVAGVFDSGIPAVGWIEAGYFYHNSADSPDLISAVALRNMTQAYAEVINKVGEGGIDLVNENGKPSPPPIYDSEELFFFLSQW